MRSPLDSVVAAYVLVGLALACFGVCVALFCRERDIRPIRKALRIFELPVFKAAFLLTLVIGTVHYAVSKGDGSPPRAGRPSFQSPALSAGTPPVHFDPPDVPLLPAWTNAVTNLLLTGIARTTNGVVLGAARPLSAGYRSFDIWSSPALDPPDWRIVGYSEFPAGYGQVECFIPFTTLSAGADGRAFFGLEVSYDSDRDGLLDTVENELGTDPYVRDSDGDGLPDGAEASWIEAGTGDIDEIPFSGGSEVSAAGQTSGLFTFDVPFPFRLGALTVEKVVVDVHGAVYLGTDGVTNGLVSAGAGNMAYDSVRDYATVAGYSTALKLRTDLGSRIRAGHGQTDDDSYFIVEYDRVGFITGPTNEVSFRVVLRASRQDTVSVVYGPVVDSGRNETTSIGARGGHDERGVNQPHLPVYYGRAPSVAEGDVYVYHFGRGGSPLDPDTDEDGVGDGEEDANGTHPRRKDTDDDGLPDRWEIDYGLGPASADGIDGASGDFDGDMVPNIDELAYGTDPADPDTDGDGLSDGEELGWIERASAVWVTPPYDILDITPLFPSADDSLVSCPLPVPVRLQNEVVTNVIVDVNGICYFPRAGASPTLHSLSSGTLYEDFSRDVFVLAPLWQNLYLGTNAPAQRIRMFMTECGSNACVAIEYADVCPYTNRSRTGAVSSASVQALIPVSGDGGIRVNYSDVQGGLVDGRITTIGFRGFGYDGPAPGLLAAPRPPRVNGPGDGWVHVAGTQSRGFVTNGLSLVMWPGTGSDPHVTDTDGDGLSDHAERSFRTSAINADTDDDGMPDKWETDYDFDPADPSDAEEDEDEDGVTNSNEYRFGLSPVNPDCDDDGIEDGDEIVRGTDPLNPDTDVDGLDDGEEAGEGTNPSQPDSDGDGLDDGWERKYDGGALVPSGTPVTFDPMVDNRNDADVNNDPSADPDGDGLSNAEECAYGTNPCDPDTDRDGVGDRPEISQGSDPTDPTDRGDPSARVAVSFYFGDHSGSHSEKYRLTVVPNNGVGTRPASFRRVNALYGECETRTVYLKPGWSYEVRLFHSGTKEDEEADYDYTLRITGEVPANVIVVDSDSLLGVDETSYKFAGDGKAARLYVLGNPRLVPDYDRDGKIDDADVAKAKEGKVFRFWINDDNDDEDKLENDSANDIPGSGPNHSNGHVDGRCDLLDFTPILLDVNSVVACVPESMRSAFLFRLRQQDEALNVVWTSLDADRAGAFQTNECGQVFGSALSAAIGTAESKDIKYDGTAAPDAFAEVLRADGGRGVILVEGCHATTNSLWLEVMCAGDVVCSNALPCVISPVEKMYRWLGLRHVCGDDDIVSLSTNVPPNCPDNETDDQNFVFVHGYSVGPQSARGWASEMFKRLWQSGLQSKFTAVDWYGDDSRFHVPFYGDVSPDYYANVQHAFETARHLPAALASLPGEKVMLAHSLGNMVVSSAAVDHGLSYSKYYMLNAAVPMEAYDAVSQTNAMVDAEWAIVSNQYRASGWHSLFADTNDFRSTLTWRGRFAGIQNAVNCYSETEDVLANAQIGQAKLAGGAWKGQELTKGTTTWDWLDTFSLGIFDVSCEGGWGVNTWYGTDPSYYIYSIGFKAKANTIGRETAIVAPLFTKFTAERDAMHSTNLFVVADADYARDLKAKFLADAIPAESFAAGANALSGASGIGSYNFQSETPNGWPKLDDDDNPMWEHSDLKNVAYFYVYKLFKRLVRDSNQGE